MAKSSSKRVLVLGGGIAGAAAAAALGRAGLAVTLVERQPLLGGQVAGMGCKAAETCLHCHVCAAVDIFKGVLRAPLIRVLTRARLTAYEPDGGGAAARAEIAVAPGFIQPDRCTGCGACLAACPTGALELAWPAVYGGQPVLRQDKCLRARCQDCDRCARACPAQALDLQQNARRETVDASALIAATGFQPFDPSTDAAWGYGLTPNVISGVEAERQLARAQRIFRPSDGRPPRRLAFIQCVGSRSEQVHRRPEDTDFCSAVCCAYALRMARRALQSAPETTATVFYMDLQNFGRDFNSFVKAAPDRLTLVHARPGEVRPGPGDTVRVRYEDQGRGATVVDEFDLLILVVGIRPDPDTLALAELIHVPADPQGFLGLKGAGGLADTGRPWIFLAGACEAPKDIAASISQAEAVAVEITGHLAPARTRPRAARPATGAKHRT